jgi:DNA-binding IclR family transcriptional regulator
VDYDTRARTYTPSVRVALLGSWLMGGANNNDSLLAIMQDLSSETGDTIMLGVLNGVETQYIHVINSYQRLRFHLRPGMMRPMFRTAVGLVLVSLRDDAEIGRSMRPTSRPA